MSRHIVFVGLSVTSSWGNGHATNFRGLMKELHRSGHAVTFLERDVPWYAAQRDLARPPFGTTHLYDDLDELRQIHAAVVAEADLVVVGSYVPDGVAVAEWVLATAGGFVAFYDIDTPVTLAQLEAGTCSYLVPELIPRFDVYLSFTGGPTIDVLRDRWRARDARPFYCLVDDEVYRPVAAEPQWDLGYLGTYSPDRQPAVESLLLDPARRCPDADFVVAGPQYPADLDWPVNVGRIEHLPPADHPAFYCGQRFTLNVTRADMIRAGWSPSVRLFEAAACGTPIISDRWEGIEHFLRPGEEILLVDSGDDVVAVLAETSSDRREDIADRARRSVLRSHSAARRAEELVLILEDLVGSRTRGTLRTTKHREGART